VSNMEYCPPRLASTGYLAGQASRAGKTPIDAAISSFITQYMTGQGLPLPSASPLQDIAGPIKKAAAGTLEAEDLVPKSMTPKVVNFAEEMIQKYQDTPGPGRSRYRPLRSQD